MDVLSLDDENNEWIRSTRRQVGLMRRMVDDMVFLAKADEGRPRAAFVPFDLARLLRSTAEPFVLMAEAGDRTLLLDCPDAVTMTGDEKSVERLISVLCDNAIKYSPAGDTLRLSLTVKGSWAVLATENASASPLPPEKLRHLFDRFYRGDEARTHGQARSGFGIGLSIALAVAELHGGTAEASMRDDRLRIECRLKLHS